MTGPTTPNRRWGRGAVAAAVAGAVLAATAGCSTTMRDVPVPGTGVSGDTVELKAEFDEALNLAEGAPVKVNGVDSGKVTSVTVEDYVALVTMDVRTDAEVRDGATARLRYTTPLGELFIDITNPSSGEVLAEGTILELPETETAPTVEDALAQASLLVNGGGLGQLQTITEELNTALGGNEDAIRGLLDRSRVFLTEANATTSSIDQVLTSLNSLSRTLTAREELINRAVREIRPAAAVLKRVTPEFTRLLQEVEQFSSAANSVANATRTRLLQLLGELEPVLAELAANRGRFEQSLDAIVDAADAADQVIPGDYLNISLDLNLAGLDASGNETLGPLGDLLDLLDGILPKEAVPDVLGLGDGSGAQQGKSGKGAGPGDKSDSLGLDGLLNGLQRGGA